MSTKGLVFIGTKGQVFIITKGLVFTGTENEGKGKLFPFCFWGEGILSPLLFTPLQYLLDPFTHLNYFVFHIYNSF